MRDGALCWDSEVRVFFKTQALLMHENFEISVKSNIECLKLLKKLWYLHNIKVLSHFAASNKEKLICIGLFNITLANLNRQNDHEDDRRFFLQKLLY